MSDSKKYGYMILGFVEFVVGVYLRKVGEAGLDYGSWRSAEKYATMYNIGLYLLIGGIAMVCLDIIAIYWTNKHIREIGTEEYAKIRCPKCDLMLTAGVHVCPRCGTELSVSEEHVHQENIYQGNAYQENIYQENADQRNVHPNSPEQANQYNSVPRFCAQCGAHLEENSVFCPNCGKRVANK